MSKWNYGDAYLRHPIVSGQTVVFDDGSQVKEHDIFEPLPAFMQEADMVFVDPPWNLGNLNGFYTKADRTDYQENYEHFYRRLFECIGQIAAPTCYVEVGKEHLADFIMEMRRLYRRVTFYNSMYYRKQQNICYVIRGSRKRERLPLDYLDEEDIISWICTNEDYSCIGDLCIGRGLVGLYAHRNMKRFVGTELNGKRLSVLLEKMAGRGNNYRVGGEL